MESAKIIRDEQGPMLIIPEKYSFDCDEAWIVKKNNIIYIIPNDGVHTEDEVKEMFG